MVGDEGGAAVGDELTIHRLTTSTVPVEDRYAFWESSLSESNHPVRLSPVEDAVETTAAGDFRADFLRVDAGTAKISMGTLDPVRAETTAAGARQHSGDVVHLSFHDGGRQVVESRQGRQVLDGQSLLLLTDDEANRHTHVERVPMVLLSVSSELLTVPLDSLRASTFVALPVDDTVRSLMLGAADVARRSTSSLHGTGMSTYLAGVAELVLRTVVGRSPDHLGTAAVRRAQVRETIRGGLADPHLTTESVAQQVGVSARRLHQLFQGGPTVAAQIRAARLELAMSLLRDPLWAGQPVTAVARRCGYLNHSQFSRAFRARTGSSPSDYRH